MKDSIELVNVNENNVSETGFFCYMSKKKSEGYQRKLKWLKARFAEGMKIKIIRQEGRGFIEYIPGEYAWRPVNAKGYMFIHCLWIVGKNNKGKGHGSFLLDQCIKEAKALKMKGVAVVTSERVWLIKKKLFEKHGFESVDQAPPCFNLMVKKFGKAKSPSFTGNWDKKQKQYGKGLTILRSDQCPYITDAVNIITETAKELGKESRVIELENCQSIHELSPSAFGLFSIINNGTLLSYHYLAKKDFLKRLEIQGK
ncbi:MAG: GNAT family N-acetyltransferase [Desulfobacterales bacterium]|nr:GNAT family N-acetyltransferase [Desulfobacterales bacterium]